MGSIIFGWKRELVILFNKLSIIESSLNPDARSHTADHGLFQVNAIHWNTTCSEYNVFDIKGNALCAGKILNMKTEYSKKEKHWWTRYHSGTPSKRAAYLKRYLALGD